MKYQNIEVSNFEGAFRGLRNPMDSWKKSDSEFGMASTKLGDGQRALKKVTSSWCDSLGYSMSDGDHFDTEEGQVYDWLNGNGIVNWDTKDYQHFEYAYLGPNDLGLAKRMILAGNPNDKFMRQIFISIDITAPLFWWKQLDTYKVGTVSDSCSTMHKLASNPITMDCFETDDYIGSTKIYDREPYNKDATMDDVWKELIEACETLRQRYNETHDKQYWKELVRILPESWLQKRTWTANYEVLRNIYFQRKNHKLSEWRSFNAMVEKLPYAKDLICLTK